MDNSNIIDHDVLVLTLPPSPLIVLSVHSSNVLAVSLADFEGAAVGTVEDDGDVFSSTSMAKIINLSMMC